MMTAMTIVVKGLCMTMSHHSFKDRELELMQEIPVQNEEPLFGASSAFVAACDAQNISADAFRTKIYSVYAVVTCSDNSSLEIKNARAATQQLE